MTRIYTRKGDDGTTSLWYGGRVGKDDGRTDAYGTLDEANAALGIARSLCRRRRRARRRHPAHPGRAVRRRRRAGDRARSLGAPRGRRQPHHRRDGERARAPHRQVHGPGRPPSEVRPARWHHAFGAVSTSRAPSSAAPSAASSPSARPESWPRIDLLRFLNRASDLLFAMARYADVDDPKLFAGRGKGG